MIGSICYWTWAASQPQLELYDRQLNFKISLGLKTGRLFDKRANRYGLAGLRGSHGGRRTMAGHEILGYHSTHGPCEVALLRQQVCSDLNQMARNERMR